MKKAFCLLAILGISFSLVSFNGSHQKVKAASVGATYYQVLDNDDGILESGKNDYTNFAHKYATSSYRGDHRISLLGKSGDYSWKFDARSGGRLFYVHLNSLSFNDTNAYYNLSNLNSINGPTVAFKNQQTAPGGWSNLNTSYIYSNYDWPWLTLKADSNGNTGADGVEQDFY